MILVVVFGAVLLIIISEFVLRIGYMMIMMEHLLNKVQLYSGNSVSPYKFQICQVLVVNTHEVISHEVCWNGFQCVF